MRHHRSGQPLKPPSPFKGESALRAKTFLANLKVVFYSAEENRASKRIAYAVKYLEGKAKTLWDQKYSSRDIDSMTWEDFETFVNDSLGDPAFRMLMAAVDYENAYQEKEKRLETLTTAYFGWNLSWETSLKRKGHASFLQSLRPRLVPPSW